MKIIEHDFDIEWLDQYASTLSLGNGSLGLRAAHPEDYENQTRGMFLAGVYSRPIDEEKEELVNLPDVIRQDIYINGHKLNLLNMKDLDYERYLDLEKAELVRKVSGFVDSNFITIEHVVRVHPFIQNLIQVECSVVSQNKTKVSIVDMIDAQISNHGKQMVLEDDIRVLDRTLLASYQTITQRNRFQIALLSDGKGDVSYSNRMLSKKVNYELDSSQELIHRKSIMVSVGKKSLEKISEEVSQHHQNFASLQQSHVEDWQCFWNKNRIEINSENSFDQKAIDFSLYHMRIMTPLVGEDLSIGAKGLSGEGYKGHVFWDAEIYNFPFVLHWKPHKAKELLLYRYNRLAEAKKKAKENGYAGALFPWESAVTGKEETPEYAAMNIKTGKRQKVASAIAEHHIVADIAYAVNKYYNWTQDQDFMLNYGIELYEETAKFWLSRTEKTKRGLEILNVIGPDEYTEFINNNAFTNYMAAFNVSLALKWSKNEVLREKCQDFLENIYLPQANNRNIIPQDDTFLKKPRIDIEKYRKEAGKQSILLDYSRDEVIAMQVLKQADVVMLLWLLRDQFSEQVHHANLNYYEPLTIHDSSLSRNVHASLLAYLGQVDIAYRHFEKGMRIDLENGANASKAGIHAASLASIWNTIIQGFLGLQVYNGVMHLNPQIPPAWKQLSMKIYCCGHEVDLKVKQDSVSLYSEKALSLYVYGEELYLNGEMKEIRNENSSSF